MTDVKTCASCKYVRNPRWYQGSSPRCTHPDAVGTDVITGRKFFSFCSDERRSPLDGIDRDTLIAIHGHMICGREGRNWEPK